MKSARFLILGLFVAGMLLGGIHESAQAVPAKPLEFLVKLRGRPAQASVERLAAKYGGQRRTEIVALGVHVLRFPAQANAQVLLARLRSNAEVSYAEPNAVVTASWIPDDPGYASQWGLAKTEAAQGWDIQSGSLNTTIAIVDTGVDPDHPDLQGKRVLGWNYDATSAGYQTPTTTDDNGHGTHVAGIAAAASNNGVGVAGMCASCSFMAVKVLGADGTGTYDAVAAGIIFAADNGARIINLSLSGTSASQTLQDAVSYATNKGALLIAAAGNDGGTSTHYPAAYAEVMAVAATDQLDQRAGFSSYNSYISVAAPGVDIYSTSWSTTAGSSYRYLSGTSTAAPFVSGLAGLLISQDVTRVHTTVRKIIEQAADDIGAAGRDQETGYGRINVFRALTGSITGIATDMFTSEPLAGARVVALQDGTVVASSTTNAGGSYRLAPLRPGQYDVQITLTGYTGQKRTEIAVAAGEERTGINFSLSRTGAVAGQITSGRKPVAGATIEAVQGGLVTGFATSDLNGHYQIPDLAAGTYAINVTATGYRSQMRSGVVVNAGQTTSGVNFALKKQPS